MSTTWCYYLVDYVEKVNEAAHGLRPPERPAGPVPQWVVYTGLMTPDNWWGWAKDPEVAFHVLRTQPQWPAGQEVSDVLRRAWGEYLSPQRQWSGLPALLGLRQFVRNHPETPHQFWPQANARKVGEFPMDPDGVDDGGARAAAERML